MNRTARDSAFNTWWRDEGSKMHAVPCEAAEAFIRRICEIAWVNGAYKQEEMEREAREATESRASLY